MKSFEFDPTLSSFVESMIRAFLKRGTCRRSRETLVKNGNKWRKTGMQQLRSKAEEYGYKIISNGESIVLVHADAHEVSAV